MSKSIITYVRVVQIQTTDSIIDGIRRSMVIESEGTDNITVEREALISYLDEAIDKGSLLYDALKGYYGDIEGEFHLVYFYT